MKFFFLWIDSVSRYHFSSSSSSQQVRSSLLARLLLLDFFFFFGLQVGLVVGVLDSESVFLPPDTNYCGITYPPVVLKANFTIKHVIVITRHGDRTPASSCWKGGPVWDCLSLEDIQMERTLRQANYRIYDLFYQNTVLPGTCGLGQLTRRGYDQLVQSGSQVRSLYLQQARFLPPVLVPGVVNIRSTNYQRTKYTAQAFMEGLYPLNTSTYCIENQLRINTNDMDVENMYVNPAICPVLTKMETAAMESDEVIQFLNQVNKPLMLKLSGIFGWSVNKSLIQVFDCLETHACNYMAFPNGMTVDLFNQVIDNILFIMKAIFTSTFQDRPYHSIGISSFISDLLAITDSVFNPSPNSPPPPKLSLFSGHDTTLLPVLMAYNIWDQMWPGYSSNIIIELLENPQREPFVRVLHNFNEAELPACNYASPCPYSIWRNISLALSSDFTLCNH